MYNFSFLMYMSNLWFLDPEDTNSGRAAFRHVITNRHSQFSL
jgi:hypothetical protein